MAATTTARQGSPRGLGALKQEPEKRGGDRDRGKKGEMGVRVSADKYIGPGGDVEGSTAMAPWMCSTHHSASCSKVGGDPGRDGLHCKWLRG